jgi:hypothetical protein
MKFMFPAAALAALAFGCSHGSANTRTAANDSGTTSTNSDSALNGGQPTAGTVATGNQGTSVASNGASANNSVPSDTNAPNPAVGSTASNGQTGAGYGTSSTSSTGNSGTNTPNSPSGTNPGVGSTTSNGTTAGGSVSAHNGTAPVTSDPSASSGSKPDFSSSGAASMSNGSPHGTNTPGLPGSAENNPNAGSTDEGSLRTVTGAVAKIDSNSITLDQSAGGVTLTVDSSTQIMRRGKAVTAGISAIHEGQQIRAKFDPASNRADKIEVMGTKKHHKDAAATPAPQ